MRLEMLLAGAGGQGIVLAGYVISKAVSLGDNHVTQSQNYGPEARGGSSKCEIVISSEEIAFPEVSYANIAAFLTTESYEKFKYSIRENTIVLLDSHAKGKGESIPFRSTCIKNFNEELFTNILMVGYLAGRFRIGEKDMFYEAMKILISNYLEDNFRAFEIGYQMGEEDRCG